MAQVSFEPFQNADKGAGQVIVDCLSNPVILRKVLQNVSTTKLLELSLVNKQWNYEAQSILRKRGNVIALLKCDRRHPCQEVLTAFRACLKKMKAIPFSGIRIESCHCGRAPRKAAKNVGQDALFDRLPLKNVSLKLEGKWWMYQGSLGFLMVKKVLQQFNEVLEELSLQIGTGRDNLIQLAQGCSFPRLRILRVEKTDDDRYCEMHGSFVKSLVALAPNLQELHTDGPINLMINALEGSSAVFVQGSLVGAPFDIIPENIISKLRLERIHLQHFGTGFNFERYMRITPVLLQASCSTTLREVNVDAVLAVSLMRFGVCLKNVKDLDIWIDHRQLELHHPQILGVLKNFDFARIFPNLDKVNIGSCFKLPELLSADTTTFIEQAMAALVEPLPDRAVNIKKLSLRRSLSRRSAPFFAAMFPNTESLKFSACGGEPIPFGSIWKHWAHLKELVVNASILDDNYLDSVFCGIFPEEVAELREKDDEFLRSVNIVPVKPSITCLRNLTALRLNYGDQPLGLILHNDHSFIFSKVTGFISFARCPNLAVSVETSNYYNYEAMRHMKPYVSVVLANRGFPGLARVH